MRWYILRLPEPLDLHNWVSIRIPTCKLRYAVNYIYFRWNLGKFLCKMYQFTNSFSYTASILILIVICSERYFAIIYPITCKQILTPIRLKVSRYFLHNILTYTLRNSRNPVVATYRKTRRLITFRKLTIPLFQLGNVHNNLLFICCFAIPNKQPVV